MGAALGLAVATQRQTLRFGMRRMVLMGDSIWHQALQNTATLKGYSYNTCHSHIRYLSGQALKIDVEDIVAFSGTTSAQWLAVQLPAALARRPDFVVVPGPTNDLTNDGLTYADSVANLRRIYAALLSAGILVITCPILPRGAPTDMNATRQAHQTRLNEWIKNYAQSHPMMRFINPIPDILDYATTEPKAGMSYDQTHSRPLMAQKLAAKVVGAVQWLIPPVDDLFALSYDTYDATTKPTGNLLNNGLMANTGTPGSLQNSATGTVPQFWSATRNTTGPALAVSIEDHATLTGLKQAVMTLSGVSSAVAPTQQYQNTLNIANVSPGDRLVMKAHVSWDAPVNVLAPQIQLFANGSGGLTVIDGYQGNIDWVMPTEAGSIIMQTPELVVPSGTTVLRAIIGTKTAANTAATSGVFRWDRISVRKVLPLD